MPPLNQGRIQGLDSGGGAKASGASEGNGGSGGNPPENFFNFRWSNINVQQFLSNLIRDLNFLPVT